jgi:hypothetical protein
LAVLTLLVIYVTMVYGPIAAALVELLPNTHPLYLHVAALSHRQWLVRQGCCRPPASPMIARARGCAVPGL